MQTLKCQLTPNVPISSLVSPLRLRGSIVRQKKKWTRGKSPISSNHLQILFLSPQIHKLEAIESLRVSDVGSRSSKVWNCHVKKLLMTKKNQGQIRKSLRRNFSWKFEELNETTSSFVVRSFEDDIGWIACLMVDLWLLWSRIGLKSVKSWNRPGLDLGVRKVNHLHLHLGKFIMFRQDNHLHAEDVRDQEARVQSGS